MVANEEVIDHVPLAASDEFRRMTSMHALASRLAEESSLPARAAAGYVGRPFPLSGHRGFSS